MKTEHKYYKVIEQMKSDVINNLMDLEIGYGRRKFAISEGTGIPEDILTILLKQLKSEGKVQLICLFSEYTGRPDGSGYCLTGQLN